MNSSCNFRGGCGGYSTSGDPGGVETLEEREAVLLVLKFLKPRGRGATGGGAFFLGCFGNLWQVSEEVVREEVQFSSWTRGNRTIYFLRMTTFLFLSRGNIISQVYVQY